jgi:DJ-1/PfpI family
MSTETPSLSVGMVLYPLLTQLDLAGPYEVFARMPRTDVHLIATSPEPIPSEHGLTIAPTTDFDSAPPLDVLFIPGGPGQQLVMEDECFVSFLRNTVGKHGTSRRSAPARCCLGPRVCSKDTAPRHTGCSSSCLGRLAPSRPASVSWWTGTVSRAVA